MNFRLNSALCRGNYGTTYNTSYLKPGNGNRGRVGGILKYPPGRKILENTPLEILGNFFKKPGKTEKIR